MNRLAQFFSFVFSPLLIPSYGVWLAFWTSVLTVVPINYRWGVTAMVFVFTCVVPLGAIAALYKLKFVSDPGLNKQGERTVPYVITALCYGVSTFYLYHINAPLWLVMFMAGGLLAAVISLIVNRWWKISAHMAAVGGLVGLMMRIGYSRLSYSPNVVWVLIAVILIAGIVGTSRLILHRHTLGQVGAGALNGFLCVFLLSAI